MNVTNHLTVSGYLTANTLSSASIDPPASGATSGDDKPGADKPDDDSHDVRAGFAHVSVLDISRADADATTVGDVVIGLDPVGPNFPIRFDIEVVGEVQPNHRYCVRAVVRSAEGTLRWTTDMVYPVDLAPTSTPGHRMIDVGTLKLVSVGRNARSTATTPVNGLIVGAWECTTLDDRQIVAGHPPVFEFLPDGRVAGTTGCNRFNAQWSLDGSRLTVGPAATTMRACIPALNDQEAAVLALLNDASAATVTVDRDELRIDTPGSHHLRARRTTIVSA